MPGPITGLLKRSPRERTLRSGFVLLFLLLLVTRVLPFLWSYQGGSSHLQRRSIEEGIALASGESPTKQRATLTHGPSYLLALQAMAYKEFALAAQRDDPSALRSALIEKTWLFRFLTRLIGSVAWIILSLQMYYIIKWRSDYSPALFALWLMTLSPLALAEAAAGGISLILALIVFNALVKMMKIRSRGQRKDYIFASVLIALASSFAYHFVALLIPLAYVHLRSQNRSDNFFADLEWHFRGILGILSLLLSSILFHPQLWRLIPPLFLSNPILQLAEIPKNITWTNLLLNNDLDSQVDFWKASKESMAVFHSLGDILGYGALVLSLILGLRGIFQRDQRPWRPMILFAYVFIAFRFLSPSPGGASLVLLAPLLCIMLSVGLLSLVLRYAFSSERKVLSILGLLLASEAIVALILPLYSANYRTAEEQFRWKLRETNIEAEKIFPIASNIVSLKGRIPSIHPRAKSSKELYKHWSDEFLHWRKKAKAAGATHVLYSKNFIEALSKVSAKRDLIRESQKELEELKLLIEVDPQKSENVVGSQLFLRALSAKQ